MITGHQIRAARALLNWGAERLAEEADLNRDTVHNIENGKVQARGASAERILRVFVDNGVEFIGDRGVALLNENYRVLEGQDCYLRLLNEVYQTLLGKKNAEALFICVDDAISSKEVIEANLHIRNAGIKCRYLCSMNAKRFDFDTEDYRTIPEQFYTNSVMVVFGNKVATLRGTNDAVLIVTDKEQADMLRGLFEMIWLQAPKPKALKAK
ncbi:MAG: helix-turn-helix transcriptional regulator [Alphaproteobacteria bacterium]|nr:helix-turn-helix transcriptional regulator [Alphaproteobacteria bacterium]